MDMGLELAKNVVAAKYEMLPHEIVEITKKSILDTLGVMLAASTLEPACQEMVELAKESGGVEESTIIAFGGKAPCVMAAFANGSLTHALDYDDVHDGFGLHPTAACLPAALALSERIGKVAHCLWNIRRCGCCWENIRAERESNGDRPVPCIYADCRHLGEC